MLDLVAQNLVYLEAHPSQAWLRKYIFPGGYTRHMGKMVFQMQIAKRKDAVPLTRDYIIDFERNHAGRVIAA